MCYNVNVNKRMITKECDNKELMSSKLESKKDLILSYIADNVPKQHIARLIGCNIKTLNNYLATNGIEYQGNQGACGYKTFVHKRYIPYAEYIKVGVVQSNKLRQKLIKEGFKKHQCELCGLITWMAQPIPLEVHHKDGDKTNNELGNLELLCPNCHALTPTYRGKNIKKK